MARKNDQSYQRTLRRYAIAGNLKACRHLLLQRLEEKPDDEEAKNELQRLEDGLPLRATETAAQRKKREATEACETLLNIMDLYPEPSLSTRSTERLSDLRSRIQEALRKLKAAGQSESPALKAYNTSLQKELRRRGLGRVRRRGIRTGGILGAVALIAGIGMLYYKRAADLESDLRQSLQAKAWERAQNIASVADTPFNRLLCSELENTIHQANRWLTDMENRRKRLEKHISRIEAGHGSVSDMRLSLRAEIERELEAMPADFSSLTNRWNKLCEKEKAALEYQKSLLVRQLLTPLSPLPTYTGNPAEDTDALVVLRAEARGRLRLFRDAPKSYKLDASFTSSAEERLAFIRTCQAEIDAYKDLLQRLRHQRTYDRFRETLQNYTPRHYTPAIALMKIRDKLPAEENVRSLIQDPERKIDDNETKAAIDTLLKNGPTFTAAYPATQTQVHLMEDIFTAPSLQVCLYEITHADGRVCYTEQEPTIDASKRVHIRRSDLDPGFSTGNRDVYWDDAANVWKRTIDTRPLKKAINIDKPTFFRDRNLPALLTTVLNFRHRNCPALATAFIYHRLLQLISEHKHPLLTGISYSPTLRKHAASFKQLVEKHGIELRAGCWLGKSPQLSAAEQDFDNWFRTHSGADYTKEIKQNFGSLVKVGASFSGYINEKGQAAIFRNLAPDTAIWYLSTEGGIIATKAGEAPESPAIFSPVFTATRP